MKHPQTQNNTYRGVMALEQGIRTIKAFIFVQKETFFSRRFDLILQFIGLALNVIFIGIFAKLITINANIAQYGAPDYLDYPFMGSIIHNLFFAKGEHIVLCPWENISSPLQLSGLTNFHIGINAWRILWNLGLTSLITLAYILFFGLRIRFNLGVLVVILNGILLIFALDLFSAGFRIATKAIQDSLILQYNCPARQRALLFVR